MSSWWFGQKCVEFTHGVHLLIVNQIWRKIPGLSFKLWWSDRANSLHTTRQFLIARQNIVRETGPDLLDLANFAYLWIREILSSVLPFLHSRHMNHSSEAFKKLYCRLLKRHYFTSFCVCVSVCHFLNMLTTIVSDHFTMVLGLHRQKKNIIKIPRRCFHGHATYGTGYDPYTP